jgi:hypothetical protein
MLAKHIPTEAQHEWTIRNIATDGDGIYAVCVGYRWYVPAYCEACGNTLCDVSAGLPQWGESLHCACLKCGHSDECKVWLEDAYSQAATLRMLADALFPVEVSVETAAFFNAATKGTQQ